MQRRLALQGLGALAAGMLIPGAARATLVTGLTLKQLVSRSTHIVVVEPLDAVSSYAELGGRPSIVTDTRVRIADVLGNSRISESELTLRTLGGRVGGWAELVLGQPALVSGAEQLAFLKRDREERHWFVGMAQGHYTLRGSGPARLLEVSKSLPEIRDSKTSAVKALVGKRLLEARGLIREASIR